MRPAGPPAAPSNADRTGECVTGRQGSNSPPGATGSWDAIHQPHYQHVKYNILYVYIYAKCMMKYIMMMHFVIYHSRKYLMNGKKGEYNVLRILHLKCELIISIKNVFSTQHCTVL